MALFVLPSDVRAYRVVGIEQNSDLASEFAWRDVLAAIQKNLSNLGYYNGRIDGRFDDETRKAIDNYRRQNGIIDKETLWPAVLIHMQALGEAIQVQKSLKAARIRQIDAAKSQLKSHTAARVLLTDRPQIETADPLHNSSICLSSPTLRCLLDEALESIKGVNRDRYRNWALQDLIAVFAAAGMVEPMKNAIRRITDARLILVALRDSIAAMVSSDRMATAEETLELMPDGADRVRALLVIGKGWVSRGDQVEARRVLNAALRELASLDDPIRTPQLRADAAVILSQASEGQRSRGLLRELESQAEAASNLEIMSSIISAYAEIGDLERAQSLLNEAADKNAMRKGKMSLAIAYADRRLTDQSIKLAAMIESPRYQIVALCEAAKKFIARGELNGARRALGEAVKNIEEVKKGFARDFARTCLAEAYALIGDSENSWRTIGLVDSADMRARSLWKMWSISKKYGRPTDLDRLIKEAVLATKASDTFKRVLIWAEASVLASRSGEKETAASYLVNAIEIVRGMETRWWRARAFSRIAKSIISLELAPSNR